MTLLALVPLGLVAAASAPAGFFLYTTVRTTTRKGRQRINLYEDNDGVADALSEENHTALLSTALGVFAIISGLSTTISTAIQDAKASQLENVCGGRWAALGSWVRMGTKCSLCRLSTDEARHCS